MSVSFWILSALRILAIHYIIYLLLKPLLRAPIIRRVLAFLLAWPIAAKLDGITPDGLPHELVFGDQFWFYLVANIPICAAMLGLALILELTRTEKA